MKNAEPKTCAKLVVDYADHCDKEDAAPANYSLASFKSDLYARSGTRRASRRQRMTSIVRQ
eukprot:10202111-Alexandrium_andersonii.AAC.1